MKKYNNYSNNNNNNNNNKKKKKKKRNILQRTLRPCQYPEPYSVDYRRLVRNEWKGSGRKVYILYTSGRSIFKDITPCSPSKVNRLIVGTFRLHLQGRRISPSKKRV
jgi:hypothetical protein